MQPKAKAHETLRRLLHRLRIVTLEVLFEALGTNSRMTVFRRLKEVGYHSSFTHRGSYYTLEVIPRFDAYGLWFHEDVGFSHFGTLKQTIAHLVSEAPAGRTHGELTSLLRIRVHNTLLELVRAGRIARQDVEGLHRILYVSADPMRAKAQIECRQQDLHTAQRECLPQQETVLAILVQALKAGRVALDPEKVTGQLKARGIRVELGEVRQVFQHYGLLAGKKNCPPQPHSSS